MHVNIFNINLKNIKIESSLFKRVGKALSYGLSCSTHHPTCTLPLLLHGLTDCYPAATMR